MKNGIIVYIETSASLESFRRFLINSTCYTYIPESYGEDPEVFPEKDGDTGSIYVEAADKVTITKMRDITFVNATDVLGILYTSKSGNTKMKWRQTGEETGKVTGEASTNSLVNLITARVIDREYADELARGVIHKEGATPRPDEGFDDHASGGEEPEKFQAEN